MNIKETKEKIIIALEGEHKHSWVWNKDYECSYCKICGVWDRD